MDLEAGAGGLLAVFGAGGGENLRGIIITLGVLGTLVYLVKANGFAARLRSVIQEAIFANWQLALLGAAAIVLSLASGWRTWDGMRNFTGEPLLSLMITFGIQAVMLIVAWLIGESFAVGMNQRLDGNKRPRRPADAAVGMVLGLAIAGAVFYWALHVFGAVSWTRTADLSFDWVRFATVAMYFLMGLLVLAAFAFSISRGGQLAVPYLQGARVIARNAVLWVMFLACMGTSVFFSFDSFFGSIFPEDQRKRAAELRAQNQVSGLLADIRETIATRRTTETIALFESLQWKAYDSQLTQLVHYAQEASSEIEDFFHQQLEERRRLVAEQQERISTAQSGQAGLLTRKTSLTEELARIRSERPALAAEYAQHKSELDAKAKEVDAKRVEALAEARGVEGTGKEGRGPVYRQRMAELSKLQAEYEIKKERTDDAQKRLAAAERRIAELERELATIDGDLAKLSSEVAAAEQRIRATERGIVTGGTRQEPTSILPAFEQARAAFRQDPTVEKLASVQQLCRQLQAALASTPSTETKAREVDCSPDQANEAAAVVFALNRGLEKFNTECAGGERLNQLQTADELFGFARKCLADSGLPSADTETLRGRINAAELNRDDKAHRFVVTLNAFHDGNYLAYLSLAIAIGLDSLIFMAGLFGANAVRSPLSDVPSTKARSAQQLEAIVDTALMPHKLETARTVLAAMQPITPIDGFMAEVVIQDDDPHAADLRRVMNAGATIGAVRQPVPGIPRYEVRSELFEYLSFVTKREFEADKQHAALAEMERIISVALLPDVGRNADVVLSHLNPIREEAGFMAEVHLTDIPREHEQIVRTALNAGATFKRVERSDDRGLHYRIHGDFYRVLVNIRARLLSTTATLQNHAAAAPLIDGGSLHPAMTTVEAPIARERQLPHEPRNGTAKESDDAWREEVLVTLLDGLNLPLESYTRLAERKVAEAAVAAGRALYRMASDNLHLRKALIDRRRDWEARVENVRRRLLDECPGQPAKLAIVDETARSVADLIPALLLSPEAGFLDELIEHLEAAAGADALVQPAEQNLLMQLRDLQSFDLASETPWMHARVLIEHFETGSASPLN